MPIVKSSAKTIFSPFLTVFDRFPGEPESRITRRLKGRTVFGIAQRR